MLTVGSLFSGIGGLDLGLQRAGLQIKWQVEIDEYCQKVLAQHWPDVPRFRDVRTVGAATLAPVDLICGGFPCQDISNAGKRAGITGARSGLWGEFYRIICELRPRFVLVENVAALLGRGMGTVLGDLAARGYDAEWQVLSAAAFGAPHIRERIFILAYPARNARQLQPRQRQSLRDQSTVNGAAGHLASMAYTDSSERRALTQRRNVLDGHDSRRQEAASGLSAFCADAGWRQWATEPDVGRVAHGVPARVDRLKGLGNAVVPQVAEWIGRQIIAAT
jgi:DNA (cytosine-5)-methyltransferase 1